jgi:EAL and modified HD-GYP domain-containing signal transduction protein
MELYIARQPVFDQAGAIVGYELLHRESDKVNECTETDGEYASSRVITSAFLTMGLDSLTSGKLAFVNFTGDLLKSGVALLLPKDKLVVEILETVPPTREILGACESLKSHGYTLALDDYVLDPVFKPLADMADIIKVDFRKCSGADIVRAVEVNANAQFLAEKVETEEEFRLASVMGYSLFQGFFFARPDILPANMLPVGKLGYLKLLQAVNDANPDFNNIVSAIENDVSLSLETIRLSNSAFYGRRRKISSIRQAVVALGLDGVRKWIYLAALRRLGAGKPDVLVSTSIIRSKFMELISELSGQPKKKAEYSMLGLFSLLDAISGCTFDSLLSGLNIEQEIKDVLIGGESVSRLGAAYATMTAYENGEWEKAAAEAGKAGMTLDQVAEAYISSLRWYNEFLKASAA